MEEDDTDDEITVVLHWSRSSNAYLSRNQLISSCFNMTGQHNAVIVPLLAYAFHISFHISENAVAVAEAVVAAVASEKSRGDFSPAFATCATVAALAALAALAAMATHRKWGGKTKMALCWTETTTTVRWQRWVWGKWTKRLRKRCWSRLSNSLRSRATRSRGPRSLKTRCWF